MQHDPMYCGSVGGGTEGSLLLFGSSSSMASIAAAIAAAGDVAAAARPRLKCPRCDSLNTKFCYYNNYNLSQPRHFCKSCRRYWTKGGILRNVPVGGGSRRSASSSSGSSSSASRRVASGSTSSSSSSSRNLRRQQQHGPGRAGSPRPSSPENPSACNFHMDGIESTPTRGLRPERPGLSEESSSEEADLISTTAAIPASPPQRLPTTVNVVDGPSVDELMTAAESFPFNQLGGASCGSAVGPFQLPVQGEDMPLDVDEYGPVEFADQTVPAVPDDNTIGAVVMGARRNEEEEEEEEEVRREADLALDAIGAPQPQRQGQPADVTLDAVAPQHQQEQPTAAAAAAANYVVDNHWQHLHNVPLVSDNYDYDIYTTVGITVAGGANNYIHDNQQLQLQLQLQQPQQLQLHQHSLEQQFEGGLLWDNSGFHYHQWGGIEIDQSVLDLL